MWNALDVVENPSITQREILVVCRDGQTSMHSATRSKAPPTTTPFYGQDDVPGNGGGARSDSLEPAQMNAVMAATVIETVGTGISQSQVRCEAKIRQELAAGNRGGVATGSGDGYADPRLDGYSDRQRQEHRSSPMA